MLQPDGSPAVGPDDLAEIAREISADEPKTHGPMPAWMAAFVEKYLRPGAA